MTSSTYETVLSTLFRSYQLPLDQNLKQIVGEEAFSKIDAAQPEPRSLKEFFFPKRDYLSQVHYSWMKEPIESLTGPMQSYLIACLEEPQRVKLADLFQIAELPQGLKPLITHLLLTDFVKKLGLENFDVTRFRENLLFPLFELSKKELVTTIDLLGVYDIANELRQVVGKQRLQKIVLSLSKEQQSFLKEILAHHDKWPLPKLGLEQWREDLKSLKRAVHKRGIYRLSVAVKEEGDDFVDALVLKLDIGRGKQLKKQMAPERQEEIKEMQVKEFRKQVIKAIEYATRQTKSV